MKVVIAEKPDAAREMASILGANEKKDGYQEGNGYRVTWAFGHICQLADPEEYGFKQWRKEDLPILPDEFKLVVDPDKAKQLKIIKSLFQDADLIINATDAGREGELIFRYIYTVCGVNKKVQRLWTKDLTKKGIAKAFDKLLPGEEKDNLYFSGKGRSEADWLVGMNATRGITLAAGGELYSLGRVQTPTLALICNRFLENKNFQSKPYYQIKIQLEKDGKKFSALYVENLEEKEKAETIKNSLTGQATCTDAKVNEKSEEAPLLFDITELQKEASKRYKLSPDETLELAQELYEKHKVLSYPRTGSKYITQDVYDEIPELFSTVANLPQFKSHAEGLLSKPISKNVVDNEKVTDHHGLLPTDTNPTTVNLGGNALKIYELVVTRFLAAFSEACQKEITHLEFDNAGAKFKASGTVIKSLGWRAIEADVKEDESKEDEEEDSNLPKVNVNDVVTSKDAAVVAKKTTPKPLLTDHSLLTLMQTAGKELNDAELRKIMANKENPGIGTGATRANIIKTLYAREYIVKEKNKVIPTQKGLALYDIVKDLPIASAATTANWERALLLVEEGKKSYEEFIDEIKNFTAETVGCLLDAGGELQKEGVACPKCKEGFLKESPKAIGCTADKEVCGFVIFKEIGGKKLAAQDITDLLTKKETKLIKGFKSQDGSKTFDAALMLNEEFKVKYKFDSKAPEGVTCPKCKGELVFSGKVVSCKGCDFKLWKTIAEKELTDKQVKDLLMKGKTDEIKGFKSKAGKPFDAKVKLTPEFKTEFEFAAKK